MDGQLALHILLSSGLGCLCEVGCLLVDCIHSPAESMAGSSIHLCAFSSGLYSRSPIRSGHGFRSQRCHCLESNSAAIAKHCKLLRGFSCSFDHYLVMCSSSLFILNEYLGSQESTVSHVMIIWSVYIQIR